MIHALLAVALISAIIGGTAWLAAAWMARIAQRRQDRRDDALTQELRRQSILLSGRQP